MMWHERRVSEMAELVNGFPFESANFRDRGPVPLVRIRDILNEPFLTFVPSAIVPDSALIENGDVVIGMDGDFNLVYWRRGVAALNQRLCLLRSNGRSDLRFLAYALPPHLKVINDLTYSTTVKHLSSAQVRAIRLPAPDIEEQGVIADFLDRETARIDPLIAEQQRLIELLRERRQATIEAATGHGVDEPVSMRSSGLSWSTEIPEHWVVANIRRFATMKTGHTPSRSNAEYWVDCTIPWFTLADVWQLRDGKRTYLGAAANLISEAGLANSSAELLPAGTVVLSRTASVGFSGVMPVPMATSQDFWNWIPGDRLDGTYLMWVFRAMFREFQAMMIGSTHKTIYQSTAAAIRIPVPPLDEQRRIVAYLDEQTTKVDALIAEAERFIELARERRSALITAAVTGQIDVREAA
ncbi:restriction endonuclease subunit S [Mycolicibacterium brumae]|uniref:Restriction endonuclease subunit S n=1 Tax=Mycolicibacterium brumae TaxID=85968 RepID=A0A2G5P636_9MYCO|nr:restriction endonuclease subunit S [Mycolicibacterium brumae]MCV7192220.1 restriction endonuclease subunit S [Mycolicibacterium brumae]PIB73364.1 restriction endonuclease subunit S [Mycolicibacterium brumae]RWA18104.1 hypothetical protein MBRU_17915 [Mycolicibacterium brumae DSM 44177]UWW10655.1 restriction endonuclease subunit S [Mycolicibacterium brumae]